MTISVQRSGILLRGDERPRVGRAEIGHRTNRSVAMKRSVLVLLFVMLTAPAGAQSAEDLFQQALRVERVASNPAAAIELYRQIVDLPDAGRELVARAWLQMGKAYEVLGEERAVGAYSRVVRDFSDMREIAGEASERMAGLAGPVQESQQTPGEVKTFIVPERDSTGIWGSDLSPDGKWIVLRANSHLHLQEVETGETRNLNLTESECSLASNMRFAPDGLSIAIGCWWGAGWGSVYGAGAGNLGLYDLRTDRWSQVFDGYEYYSVDRDEYLDVVPFDWTRDGSSVLVSVETDDEGQLLLVPVGGGSATRVGEMWDGEHAFVYDNACLMQDDRYIFGNWTKGGRTERNYEIRRTDASTATTVSVLSDPSQDYHLFGCDRDRSLIYYTAGFGTGSTLSLRAARVAEDGALREHRDLMDLPFLSIAQLVTRGEGDIYFNASRVEGNWFNNSISGELRADQTEAWFSGKPAEGRILDWTDDGLERVSQSTWGKIDVVEIASGAKRQLSLPASLIRKRIGQRNLDAVGSGKPFLVTGRFTDDARKSWILDPTDGEVVDSVEVQGLALSHDGSSILYPGAGAEAACLKSLNLSTDLDRTVRCFEDAIGVMRADVSRSGNLVLVGYETLDSALVYRVFSPNSDLDQVVEVMGAQNPRDWDAGSYRIPELLPGDKAVLLVGASDLIKVDIESGERTVLSGSLPEGVSIARSLTVHPGGRQFEVMLRPPRPSNRLMVVEGAARLYDAGGR